jgi:hypothetical protein
MGAVSTPQAQVHADAFTDTRSLLRARHGREILRVDNSEKGRPTRSSGTQPSTEVTDSEIHVILPALSPVPTTSFVLSASSR